MKKTLNGLGITGLYGGGAALDGMPASTLAKLPAGSRIIVRIAGVVMQYALAAGAGTDTPLTGKVVNCGNAAAHWCLESVFSGGLPCVFDTGAGQWRPLIASDGTLELATGFNTPS